MENSTQEVASLLSVQMEKSGFGKGIYSEKGHGRRSNPQ